MRLAWAILGGLAIGGGGAWWLARQEVPTQTAHPAGEGPLQVEDRTPALYRWRDADGILHITETPPKGHSYERLPRDGAAGIQMRGDQAE